MVCWAPVSSHASSVSAGRDSIGQHKSAILLRSSAGLMLTCSFTGRSHMLCTLVVHARMTGECEKVGLLACVRGANSEAIATATGCQQHRAPPPAQQVWHFCAAPLDAERHQHNTSVALLCCCHRLPATPSTATPAILHPPTSQAQPVAGLLLLPRSRTATSTTQSGALLCSVRHESLRSDRRAS